MSTQETIRCGKSRRGRVECHSNMLQASADFSPLWLWCYRPSARQCCKWLSSLSALSLSTRCWLGKRCRERRNSMIVEMSRARLIWKREIKSEIELTINWQFTQLGEVRSFQKYWRASRFPFWAYHFAISSAIRNHLQSNKVVIACSQELEGDTQTNWTVRVHSSDNCEPLIIVAIDFVVLERCCY